MAERAATASCLTADLSGNRRLAPLLLCSGGMQLHTDPLLSTLAAARTSSPNPRLIHAPTSPLVEVVRTCQRIAQSEATVLVTGETGTGKEVFARLIHENSPRSGKALVPVNCGAIPEALLESELFGYVRGAFTGAVASRKGRIALAHGGTLFLDEIGELPLALQVKLLRLLQEKSYEPVGSNESVQADFRLVAATNRDLSAEVEAGRFRRDLYYRLLVCPVELPPLRERHQDVVPLFLHFWESRGERRHVAAPVLRALEAYDWPGNVRELENLVERLSVCVEGPSIELSDLPPGFAPTSIQVSGGPTSHPPLTLVDTTSEMMEVRKPLELVAPPEPVAMGSTDNVLSLPPPGEPIDLPGLLRTLENRYIDAALAQSGGNRKAAADLLGLQRTTLVEKLRRRSPAPAPAPRASAGEGR